MMAIEPVASTDLAGAITRAVSAASQQSLQTDNTAAVDFQTLLANGIGSLDAKVARADALVAQFAIDDSIPVHQVTIALEEARLSVEFAMQVRSNLVSGYKELMNIQL